MCKPCDHCPLTDENLIRRFCSRCRAETFGYGTAHRFHQLGMVLYEASYFAEAAAAFRAAISHGENFQLESAFDLTLCLMRLVRYDEALESIDQVLEHSQQMERSQRSDSMYLKGLTLRYLSRFDEAEEWLKRSHEAGYEKAESALVDLEISREMEIVESGDFADDPEKRLAYLVGCLSSLQPRSIRHEARLLSRAGDAARDTGDYEHARDYYVTACRTDLSAETATQLAEFVLDFGAEEEVDMAESWLREALSMEGDHGRTHFCLGRMQSARGQLEQAFHSMLSALRAIPSDEYVIFETAELAAELGNIPFCLNLLRRLEADAGDDHYWLDRAYTLRCSIGAI